jgi:hypothetical protein
VATCNPSILIGMGTGAPGPGARDKAEEADKSAGRSSCERADASVSFKRAITVGLLPSNSNSVSVLVLHT